ncbi:fibronectin type III domain-containing protein [Patescibacteria group bacterium]|nr:fibronectin type III domain-containing protein [Patescibacteria group bacterium]MBU4162221.1 fibronectin type III domain-containing protein [Patescibacteria group bacterium]
MVIFRKKYLSLEEARRYLRRRGKTYSSAYLSLLAKKEKLQAIKINKKWITTRVWLKEFLSQSKLDPQKLQKNKKAKKLEVQKEGLVLPLYFGWAIKLDFVKFYRENLDWHLEWHLKLPKLPIKLNIKFFHKKWQRIMSAFFAVCIIGLGGFLFYHIYFTSSVTYQWVQTDWSGGEDQVNYPLHPTNQTNWTKYWSKASDIKISVAGEVSYETSATLPPKTAILPTARYDAPAVYDTTSNKFYIIGGYDLDGSDDPRFLTEIVQYNSSTDVATTTGMGSLPVQLRGHSADLNPDNGKIYIFGGYDNTNSQFNSTIYTFNPASPSGDATSTAYSLPSGREYAPAVYAPNVDKFYIFGGFYLDGSLNQTYLDEIIEFNPSTGATSTITAGSLPALKGSSAVYYPVNGLIYIFGGYDNTAGDYSDKIYSFNPLNPTAGASDTGYMMPSKRAYTTAAYYYSFGDASIKKMYIFGGYRLTGDTSFYLNEVLKFDGTASPAAQANPLAKNLKSASAVFNSSENKIYVFAGFDGDGEAFSDTIYHYPLTPMAPLVSSPYNTTDPAVTLAQLSWSETLAGGTTILFQIRTASNDDNSTPADPSDDTPNIWTDWCGPDNGAAGCDTNTYFTDNAGGEAIDAIFKDAADDQWIQYKVFLITDSLDQTPVLSDVTMTYVVNTAPTVSDVTGSQDSVGAVNISYGWTDAEEATSTIYLFYDLGITLDGDIDADVTTISVSDATYLANSGTIQLDSEQITYIGKSGNDLTGCTRGANNTVYYKATHSSGGTVWIKANTATGDIGSGISAGSGKAIVWTPKTDIDGYYAASTVKVRVVANDGNAARQAGSADSSVFEFDTKDPVIGLTAVGSTGIDINGNATTSKGIEKTNVLSNIVHLASTDDTALEFILSNDGTFDTEVYESYASSTNWSLDEFCADQEYGCVKTVYVKFKDTKGNEIGPYTDTITLDNNPPAIPSNSFIQDVSNASTSQFRLFVTWDKATVSDWIRYEIYRSTNGIDFALYDTITDINLNYKLEIDLVQGNTYYYKIRSVDDIINNSDYSTTVSMEAGGNPADNVPPAISGVATSTPTINSVIVTWSTDEISTSQVIYSTNASVPEGSPTQGVSGYGTAHSVTLTGLVHTTTYYFKAHSCDASSNCSDSTIGQFTTATPDQTGPFIFTPIIVSDISENSATISWDTDESSTSFVEYSISSGFSSGTIQGDFAYVTSHEVTIHGLSPSTNYYFKVRSTDSSGNESISAENSFSTSASSEDVTPPSISDVSTSGIAYNTATATWTTNENSSSFVEFGLSTSYGRIYGQDDSVTSHSVNLPQDLLPATLYHFRVRSVDGAGNEGISGDYTFTTSGDPSDSTAPTISNVQIGEPAKTSITITWDTDEVADSYIGFSAATTTYSHEQGLPTMATSHSVTLVGLWPDTTYYFQVKSKDPSGNQQIDSNSGQGYSFTTLTSVSDPPVISNVQIIDTGSNTATITWSTNKSANSFVEYGLDTAYGYSQGLYNSATSHSVTLVGLLSQATYHFRVRSTDSDSNEGVSQDYTLTTESAADITPPVISSVQATNITLITADITWTTNENTDNIVTYGSATSSLDRVAGSNASSTTSHTVSLTNLTPGTTYYYQVQSRDAAGNITIDNNSGSYYSFTATSDTTAPVISNVAVPVKDRNSATITWDTDEDATSQAEYSLNSDLSSSTATTEITNLRQQHSVIVSGLTSDTTYYYRVISKDAYNNSATSSISSFDTTGAKEDSTAPVISSVSSGSITLISAVIIWTTNENSNSIVDYGTTVSLGSMAGQITDSATSHSVSLVGLDSGTLYYYQVRSQDSSGNIGTDNNSGSYYTFTTTADTTGPVISSVTASTISDTSATITWNTDELSTSQVVYGVSTTYGSQTTEDSTLTYQHSVTVTGLERETTYYYKVISKDSADNSTTDDNSGSGYTFTTTREPGQTVYVGGGGGGGISYERADQKPPTINDLKIDEITAISAKVYWKTDEKASGLVEYGTTASYGQSQGFYEATELEHTVVVDGLLPNTTYHLRPVSIDDWGNIGRGTDNSITTMSGVAELPIGEITIEQIMERIGGITTSEELQDIYAIIEETAQRIMEPPFIAGEYPVVETTSDSARIIWVTDQNANSMVAYSPTGQYSPNSPDAYRYVVGNREESATYHFVELLNLKPDSTYHYQIRSQGKIGPVAKSVDATFKTKPIGIEIIGLRMTKLGQDFAEFTWDTNIPASSIVEYTDLKTGKTLSQGDKSLIKGHVFKLEKLALNTEYSAVVICRDEAGNEAKSTNIEFTTGKDSVAPTITQVRANSTLYPGQELKVQTIIDWQTNEPATSQLFWKEGSMTNAQVFSSTVDTALTNKHVVVTTRFKPSTVYRFWVESKDIAGNTARSKEFTILTPQRTESVLEMIIRNFEEIFGWTKRLR